MALGKTVKALREARGWTLKDLSKRSGVPVGTIGALEVRDSVRSEYAAQLAKGFEIPLEELLPTTANAAISAPSPTFSASNHAPAHIQQAQPAINNAVSLTVALATLQDALRKTDPLDRASCKPYIAAMFDDPDRLDLVHRIVTALDPPSHKAEPEIGALRRTA